MLDTMIVIAKSPTPGRVKTRLCPPLTFEQAAVLAGAAIADTLEVAEEVAAQRHLLVLDGPRWCDVNSCWDVVSQIPGGLDRRLVGAFAAAGPGPSVLVGMDTPQLESSQVVTFDAERFDACLGMADDGGYWAIGFRDPRANAEVIRGVPMSTSHTGAAQLAAMQSRGLTVQLLDRLADFDTFDQASAVAQMCPHTRFAEAFRSLSRQKVG